MEWSLWSKNKKHLYACLFFLFGSPVYLIFRFPSCISFLHDKWKHPWILLLEVSWSWWDGHQCKWAVPSLLVMLLSGYWDIHSKDTQCSPTSLHSLVQKPTWEKWLGLSIQNSLEDESGGGNTWLQNIARKCGTMWKIGCENHYGIMERNGVKNEKCKGKLVTVQLQ